MLYYAAIQDPDINIPPKIEAHKKGVDDYDDAISFLSYRIPDALHHTSNEKSAKHNIWENSSLFSRQRLEPTSDRGVTADKLWRINYCKDG